MSDFAAIMARYEAEQLEARSRFTTNKTTLLTALAAANVTEVIVDFDGCGDSGQIESITFKSGDDTVAEPFGNIALEPGHYGRQMGAQSMDLRSAGEELAYDALQVDHAGWENNDGAFGTITFDVAASSITLDYNERFEDSTYSQHAY